MKDHPQRRDEAAGCRPLPPLLLAAAGSFFDSFLRAVYQSLLELTAQAGRDLRDLHPRDMIDIQSFLWVQESDEYEG